VQLKKASRTRQWLRILLTGATGSGKTFTALRLAAAMAKRKAGRLGVIDTENGSAQLYAGERNPDGGEFDFEVIDLMNEPGKASPENYVKALRVMIEAGIDTVVIDSGSHVWAGPGGILEFVDAVASRSKGSNSYSAWREGTPKYNDFLQAVLSFPGDVIVTLRSKMEHVQEKGDNGRTVIRKVGLQPVMRDGIEYEFTVHGDIDTDTHRLHVLKSRIAALADQSFVKAGAELADAIVSWRDSGAPSLSAAEQVLRRALADAGFPVDTTFPVLAERIEAMQRTAGKTPLPIDKLAPNAIDKVVSMIQSGSIPLAKEMV
jgi:energy-coupling factor transporter ATP-binding protein EcfA2